MRTTTLKDLKGENAFLILGTVSRLLKQLDREAGTDLAKPYLAEATSGTYLDLLAVSERYAVEHLATTLHAHEGDLTGKDDDDDDL